MNEKALLSSLDVWAQPVTLNLVLGPSTWHSRFLLENPVSLQGPDLKLLEVSSNWAAAESMEHPECPTSREHTFLDNSEVNKTQLATLTSCYLLPQCHPHQFFCAQVTALCFFSLVQPLTSLPHHHTITHHCLP